MFSITVLLASLLAAQASPPQPAGALTLAVKGAGSRGTLVFTTEGIAFQAADARKSRQWPYRELKQVRVMSPREIALDTYEDGSWWRFGADRTIEFQVTEGAIDGTLVAHLLEHAGRPVASAVLPAGLGEPTVSIAAKHLRGRKGTHGTLAIYPSGLAYETAAEGGSRYWRVADLESVLRTSPRTLLIDVYELGRVQPFAFELKEPLPDATYEALWQQVNAPAARTGLPPEARTDVTRAKVGLPPEARTDVTRAKVGLPPEARTDVTRAKVGGAR
jgi:hypothetical protein